MKRIHLRNDREFIASSCEGKEAFETSGIANRVQRRRGRKGGDFKHQQSYRCRICHAWHIGKKPKPLSERPAERRANRYGEVRLWME